jgi:hypothetical protein
MSARLNTLGWRGRWMLPGLMLALGAGALVAALLARHWLAVAADDQRALQKALAAQLAAARERPVPECAVDVSYAATLPATVSMDKIIQSLQDSSKAFGVTLVSVNGEPHAATQRTLAWLDVTATLHGGYSGLKSAMAEAVARFPAAVVRGLRIKRSAGMPLAEDVSLQFAVPLGAPTLLECRPASVDPASRS